MNAWPFSECCFEKGGSGQIGPALWSLPLYTTTSFASQSLCPKSTVPPVLSRLWFERDLVDGDGAIEDAVDEKKSSSGIDVDGWACPPRAWIEGGVVDGDQGV